MKNLNRRWDGLLIATAGVPGIASAQRAAPSPSHPWDFSTGRRVREEGRASRVSRLAIDATKVYSLAELVDFAERNNPQTRVAWEAATARAADLHIAQSELYPVLVAVALAQANSQDILFGSSFFPQRVATFGPGLQLNYTVFDFGARGGPIAAAPAQPA